MSVTQNILILLNLARREASYGTAISPKSSWYKMMGPGLVQLAQELDTDVEELTGTQYETASTVIGKATSGQIGFKQCPELFGYFLGAALGNVSTAGSTNYTHTYTAPAAGTINPWSVGLIQAQDRDTASSIKGYDGLVVSTMEYTVDDAGVINCSVDLLGDGSETDQSGISVPSLGAILSGTNLLKKDMTVSCSTDGTGDVSANFRSMTVRIDTGANLIRTIASAEKFGEAVYGDGDYPRVEIDLVLKGTKGGTYYNWFANQSTLDLDVQLTDTDDANKFITFRGHQCRIRGDAGEIAGFDETGQIITLPFVFRYDQDEDTPWTWTVGNTVAAYLAAS